jgi:hypothetical protein
MMKRLSTLLVSLTAITAAAIDFAPAAHAFSITPTTNPETLSTALFGTTTGLSNFAIDLVGDARAFGVLQDDPFGLNTSVALSTGKVADLAGVNTIDKDGKDLSTDFGAVGSVTRLACASVSTTQLPTISFSNTCLVLRSL